MACATKLFDDVIDSVSTRSRFRVRRSCTTDWASSAISTPPDRVRGSARRP
ncbi:hypothetical protein [Halococcus salifodinae]|uniref:hypothetical protein n=1 Tax=Halococcus salifodinae TaxID=36738 RepID=UPI001F4C6797|nr:hypothetical protein [Halococcus salifodinae]